MVEKLKLLKHGEAGQIESDQIQKDKVSEHLSRFWRLIPNADPDKIIKPMTILQKSVVYQECLLLNNDKVAGESDDFFYEFDGFDQGLVQ